MKNENLFKDAIADAKTLRNVALANAKKSLEEAFGPKVNSMLNNKLAEMEDLDENSDLEEGSDVDDASDVGKDMTTNENNGVDSMEEELEGILKELGMDESEDLDENQDLDENEEDYVSNVDNVNKEAKKPAPKPSADLGMDDDTPEGGESEEGSEEVTELTVAELTDIIRNVVQDAISGGANGAGKDELGGEEGGMDHLDGSEEGGEDVDLDELISELGSDDVNESEDLDENQDLDENSELDENEELAEWNAKKESVAKKVAEAKKAIEESKQWYNAKGKGKKPKGAPKNGGAKGFIKAPTGKTRKMSEVADKVKENKDKVSEIAKVKELNEAIKTIHALRSTLKETNLLNAKLLYVNKLFKAKPLTESQKMKVIAAFDKAGTRDEAKIIYESLNETLTAKKSNLKESIMHGFASKATNGVKKQVIVEDAAIKRMQKLAGII